MNELDTNSVTLATPSASLPQLQPASHLIVLVPDSEVDIVLAARKIWELANALDGRVQFLGLSSDANHEPALRRQIVTLSAMVEDKNISVESIIESGNDWLSMINSYWHKGDVIVCFSEPHSRLAHRSLNQILRSNPDIPIYVLTGLYQEEERPHPIWILGALNWVGSIGIILGFLWLQIKLSQPAADWEHTTLLYLSLFAEALLIWLWNSLFK